MMQRIAAVTVIRGNGACQAFVDGMVNEELRRQQEKLEAAEDRANRMEEDRNRLKGVRLTEIRWALTGKHGLLRRIRNAIETAWAIVWAITAGKCWIEMGETAGLWEDISDETEY